jgi:Flp pilus assembly protein TadG
MGIVSHNAKTTIQRMMGDQRANVALIFALSAAPAIFLTGMGVDYTLASGRQAQLNSIADAAALTAITPAMLSQTGSAVTTAVANSFNAQASAIPNISYDPANVKVTMKTVGAKRVVSVSYTAASQNTFPNVLGQTTIPIAGSSQATAGLAPNIDFYLLLDDSPSMAIAATQAGIATMVANTSSQGGCAFGCHETHPSSDGLGNPGGEDNYALARNLGVTLRIDLLRQAAQNLMSTAQTTETSNHAQYRMATYTFDVALNKVGALTSNLSSAASSAGNVNLLQVYSNNWLTASNSNNDADTNYDAAMTGLNSAMPNPGSGTGVAGDSPQEVMFLVTDGVEDESVSGGRQQSLINTNLCTTIKNRGVRIAVLYTTYLPLPTNSWYNSYISGFQPNIGPTLASCASPGLYFQVQTGGDISAALSNLFQLAVQSAYLSQ